MQGRPVGEVVELVRLWFFRNFGALVEGCSCSLCSILGGLHKLSVVVSSVEVFR